MVAESGEIHRGGEGIIYGSAYIQRSGNDLRHNGSAICLIEHGNIGLRHETEVLHFNRNGLCSGESAT